MASVYKRAGSKNWWISYRDEQGKRSLKSSGTTNKRTADRIAAEIEAKIALRREGVIDSAQDRVASESRRPIGEHLADYQQACVDAGQAATTVNTKLSTLRAMATALNADTIRELLQADKVSRVIASMPVKHPDGKNPDGSRRWRSEAPSARTRNARRAAVLAFVNWLK